VTTYSRRHSAPNDNPIRSNDHSANVEADDLSKLVDALERLDVPTLLLTGDQTTVINTIGVRVLERLLPRHELRTISGATHELFVEQPEASTRELITFLARH
jgi:pimeloyl-ACP methyl ester carboxylesterase